MTVIHCIYVPLTDIMDTFHDGYILEKEEQQDVFHYMIYLNDLQMMVKNEKYFRFTNI